MPEKNNEFYIKMKKYLGGAFHKLKNFLHKKDGSVAVEFALVGVPLSFMIIGIIETSVMFAANSMLNDATVTASRLIRTGQLQQVAAGDPEDIFKTEMCNQIVRLIACNQIQYEVIPIEGFTSASSHAPTFDENGNLVSGGFDAGGVNDVVLIRTVYNYPIMTPVMSSFLSNHNNNTRQMMSTIILQTEPYDYDEAGA